MKLSFLLELLLILIIIAFAASKPINEGNGNSRKVTRVIQNVAQKRQNSVPTSAAPKPTPEDDDDDDDDVVDELFDLDDDDEDDESSSGSVQKDEKDPSKPQTENLNTNDDDDDDDDEDDILGISEEEETDKDDAPSDEEFDGSEFILFGEDIFQAVFGLEDDEKKKKPAINSTLLTSVLTQTPANVHLTHTQNKKSKPKPANLEQHKANATHQLNPLDSNKNENHSSKPSVQLNLQHTPALLELAHSTQSQQNIPTPSTVVNKITENEKTKLENPPSISEDILLNKPVSVPTENDDERLDESNIEEDNDANDNGDFIIVNDKDNFNFPTLPTEDIKNIEEDISLEEEKIQDIKNPDVSENEIPQNDQNDKLIVESTVATSIQSDTLSSSTTKKPNKENDEGLFGIVESIIFDEDDDEDETKPVKSGNNTDGNKDGKPEESVEDENEADDDDDDEDDEDEEENSDKISEKPESVSDSTNDINKLKKKKKKQAGFIDTLGETLGLSRVLRHQRTEKVISH